MKRRKTGSYSADFFVMLVVFLIYAGAMILLVYMGTAVYRSVTEQMERHYSARTAQAYITEKIRQNDVAGRISVEEVEQTQVLAFREPVGEQVYITYIYEYEGQLKELCTKEGREVALAGGSSLLEVQAFSVEAGSDGEFRVQLTDMEGARREFVVYQDSVAVQNRVMDQNGNVQEEES